MKSANFREVAAILLAFSFPAFSLSQPAGDAKAKPTETQSTHLTWRQMMDKLQLTGEQRQAVLKNRHAYRREMAELDGKVKVKQVELENELEKPDADQTKLDLICQEIGVLYGQRLGVKVQHKLELERKILMPQQVDLLKTLQGKEASPTDEGL